jgi:hypothetical protein
MPERTAAHPEREPREKGGKRLPIALAARRQGDSDFRGRGNHEHGPYEGTQAGLLPWEPEDPP